MLLLLMVYGGSGGGVMLVPFAVWLRDEDVKWRNLQPVQHRNRLFVSLLSWSQCDRKHSIHLPDLISFKLRMVVVVLDELW